MNWIGKFALVAVTLTSSCPGQTRSSGPDTGSVVWSPPGVDWPDTLPRSTVPVEMISKLWVAKMPIVLEKTLLDDARKHFGGTIGSQGDAGDAEAWVCLYGSDANGRWIFWLTSGEIDGPRIGGFQWRRLATQEIPDRRCVLLRQEDGGIELPHGLRVGVTEAEVRKILGKPTVVRGNTLIFCHEHQQVTQGLTYTASNNVTFVLRDGTAWAIEVTKDTTN